MARLLAGAETVEQAFAAVMQELARHMPVASAALVEDDGGDLFVSWWAPQARGCEQQQAARDHLAASFRLLVGTPQKTSWPSSGEPFRVFPLAAGGRPVFGALQLEASGVDPGLAPLVRGAADLIALALDRDRVLRRDRERGARLAVLERTLREQQAELHRADRRGSDLLRDLADDLERLLAGAEPRDVIGHAARHVAELRVHSQLDREVLQSRKTLVDIGAMLAHTAWYDQAALAQRGQTLTVRLPAHQVFVVADAARIGWAFAALLEVVADQTEPGTALAVEGSLDDVGTCLVVGLHGPSAPGAPAPRLWAPKVAQRVIELHGGALRAKDGSAPGLEVTLPVHRGASAHVQAPPCSRFRDGWPSTLGSNDAGRVPARRVHPMGDRQEARPGRAFRMTMNHAQPPTRAAIEASIDHWLEQAGANGLPRDVLMDVFETMLHRLWTRAGATVGPVSMTARADEALRRLAERYPVFAPLEIGPDGRLVAPLLRQNAATLHHVKLVEGLRYLLTEFLSLLSADAAAILSDESGDAPTPGDASFQDDEPDERDHSAQPHRFNANLRPGLRTNASDSSSAWVQT